MILINNKDFSKLRFSDVEKFLREYDEDESFFVELKNNDISTKDLIKEICAFSNTFGGYIFLGVEDNKTITGCDDWTEEKINNAIRNMMTPTPIFDVKRITKKETKIFIIRIEEGTMPPYITNKGIIYERISSSSFPIKDSSTINRLLDKRKENINKIESKLYIPPINSNINNLCGYLDFGFSASFKDFKTITDKIFDKNYEEIATNILKKTGIKYSVSRVGYSICITIGDSKIENSHFDVLTPAGLTNFMEILSDGSVRGRIILSSSHENNIVPIHNIIYMKGIFKDIYAAVLKNGLCKNFIEARCCEKLTVLKIFQPRFMAPKSDEYYEKFKKYNNNHKEKYGSNVVANSNRIPINDFYIIDRSEFEKRKVKYNDNNLIDHLFNNPYFMLGYIDSFESEIETDD